MRTLWYLFIALVTLGSIYPFNFSAAEISGAAIADFLRSCCGPLGRGDTVANIILFMPVGFTGMLGVWLDRPIRRRLILVFFWGTTLALMLQVLQLYLPSRDENLQDILWNAVGIFAGAAIAVQIDKLAISRRNALDAVSVVPVALVGAWLTYRLMPFVPSIDWQLIKDSVKPVFFEPVSFVGWFSDSVAWSVVAFLLYDAQKSRHIARRFVFLVAAVLFLEVVIVANTITLTNILGALTAILAWKFFLRGRELAVALLAVGLVAAIVLLGLHPFSFRTTPGDFHWLPFRGYLGGSMYINAQSAAEKVFLYGSLIYLLWKTSLGRSASVIGAFLLVFLIEILQVFFRGHTPEFTDPLLVLFAAFSLVALERYAEQSRSLASIKVEKDFRVPTARHSAVVQGNDKPVSASPALPQTNYVIENVNLRGSHVAFLQELSREMDETFSGIVGMIVEQFVDCNEKPGLYNKKDIKWISAPTGATRSKRSGKARSVHQTWEQRSIEIPAALHAVLADIAEGQKISVSRVIRRMIAKFMDRLDED